MLVITGNTLRFLVATFCIDYFQLVNGAFSLSHSSEETFSRFKRATCSPTEFICNNKQCISKFFICDGRADCNDKSDESAKLCSNLGVICPSFSFQCDYGACVDGHAKCNGVQDCVDGSDENLPECSSASTPTKPPTTAVTTKAPNYSCLNNQYQCSSGQCINKHSLCDGKADCNDGSDEISARCKDIPCGNVFFRCRYGACVRSDAKCDGVQDCKDGSDEAPSICGGPKPTSRPGTNQPVTDGCKVPPPLQGGQFILGECALSDTSPSCIAQTDEIKSFGSELSLRCIEGYSLVGVSPIISCGSSRRWNPLVLPSCRRTCKPLVSANLIITCTLTEFENGRRTTKTIPCDQPMFEGTKAHIKCPAFFVERADDVIFCTKSGQWDGELKECQPMCGFRDQSLSPQIIGGLPASQTDYPWHVGIYWIEPQPDGTLKYEYKCGGSLISPSTVLTAAHCGYNENSKEWTPPSNMVLALGKQKLTWDTTNENRTQRLYAVDFKRRSEYSGAESWFNWDVALIILNNPVKLTQYVFPVCINFSPNRFRQGAVGKVPGWGHTGTTETSEDLLYADIPFMNRDQCTSLLESNERRFLTFDKFCGGYTSKGPKTYKGDSGGGLVYKDGRSNYVVGIVSTTVNDPEFYVSFYTNVSYHGDWIKSNMK